MEISEINRIVNLLQKVDCTWYALIADVAREMGIKKTALMQFIDDNPKNFSIQEITITSAKGVKKTNLMQFIDDNPKLFKVVPYIGGITNNQKSKNHGLVIKAVFLTPEET